MADGVLIINLPEAEELIDSVRLQVTPVSRDIIAIFREVNRGAFPLK